LAEGRKMHIDFLNEEISKQKAISQATINIQEKERVAIGRELNENVNQVLVTIKLYLDLASSHPELREELIWKSSENLNNAISEIRHLSNSLASPSLSDLGLIDSIEDLVQTLNATNRIYCDFVHGNFDESRLNDEQKLVLFRILQEAMKNVLTHAEASETIIRLSKIEDKTQLFIKDNGKGFDPSTIRNGAGLNNIRNRVYLSNGNLTIDSLPGKGSTLVVELPS
jgi:signal transduction histidine kinase